MPHSEEKDALRKFVTKLFCFGLIILALLVIYNAIYNQLRADDQYGDGKFVHVPYEITISNTGSSHGVYAFDYSDYENEYTGFNFALVSQTLSYDYRVISEYKDHFAENGIMFIPVSYASISLDETETEDFESKNQRYYRFLSPSNIKQFDLQTYIGLHFFPAIYESTADIIKIFAKGMMHKHPIIEDDYDIGNPDFDYALDAQRAFKRHSVVIKDGHLLINQDEIDALCNIISFCKERNIRPIMITTPLRSEYADQYSPTVLDEFYSKVEEIQQEADCEYYDYSHDERFAHSVEYMRNSDHLSPAGAKAFTKILLDEVINR